jgi:uncharacterized membrane protein YbhN (UPF0104 family)
LIESNPPSFDSKSRKISWVRLLGTLLALALLVYVVVQQGWQALVDSLAQVSWPAFLGAFLLILLSRLATVGRWHVLLRSANVEIELRQSLRLVFAGLFSANFLPTTVGGDLVRFAGGVRLRLDAAVIAASLVMDRLVGMAGMATVLPFGLVRFFSLPLAAWPKASPLQQVALPAALGKALEWGRRKLAQLWQSLRQAVRLWLSRPRQLLLAYLFTWGHMLTTFLTVWLIFQALGEPISILLVAGLWSMGYFITLLPISINGLGVQEVALTYLFTNYGGVSLHSVLAMALLMRALPILASLPGALFVPALLQPEKKAEKQA